MYRALKRTPRITGQPVERLAKPVITVLLGLLYMALLSVAYAQKGNRTEYILFLTAGVSIVVLAPLESMTHHVWRVFPMFMFVIIADVHAFLLPTKIAHWSGWLRLAISILMGVLLIRTAFRLKRACGKKGSKRWYESLSSAKTPLLMVVFIDTFTLPMQLITPPRFQALSEYFTRLLFYSAAFLLASPGCFLNVRRILRLLLMVFVSAGLSLCVVFTAAHLAGLSLPWKISALFALLIPADVLMIGSFARNHKRAAFVGTSLFRPYGDRAKIPNEQKLDSALARNFMEEYAERFVNQPYAILEIAAIQRKLTELRLERLALKIEGNGHSHARLQIVEETAAELLGQLDVHFRFNMGFDDYYLDSLCGDKSA